MQSFGSPGPNGGEVTRYLVMLRQECVRSLCTIEVVGMSVSLCYIEVNILDSTCSTDPP